MGRDILAMGIVGPKSCQGTNHWCSTCFFFLIVFPPTYLLLKPKAWACEWCEQAKACLMPWCSWVSLWIRPSLAAFPAATTLVPQGRSMSLLNALLFICKHFWIMGKQLHYITNCSVVFQSLLCENSLLTFSGLANVSLQLLSVKPPTIHLLSLCRRGPLQGWLWNRHTWIAKHCKSCAFSGRDPRANRHTSEGSHPDLDSWELSPQWTRKIWVWQWRVRTKHILVSLYSWAHTSIYLYIKGDIECMNEYRASFCVIN